MENTQEKKLPTAEDVARLVVMSKHQSMVGHIEATLPFSLEPGESTGGRLALEFKEDGSMMLDAQGLAIATNIPGLVPGRTEMMLSMGMFLIQQAEASLMKEAIAGLTAKVQEMVDSGMLKLTDQISPQLLDMLAQALPGLAKLPDDNEMVATLHQPAPTTVQ